MVHPSLNKIALRIRKWRARRSTSTEDEQRAAREIALYERLKLTEKEIRDVCLVKILPGRAPGDIGVSIRNATPKDIGKYCCLSYECSPQDEHLLRNISVINESQETPNPCAVGPNLYSFLEVAQNGLSGSKAANLIDFHSDFWIDALSIDQKDIKAKNREVKKMGKIYAQASKTVIWLGHMGKPKHDWEADYKNDKKKLFKIVEAQTYWDRAWIVQEVALSREPVVLMRDFALPYDKLFAYWDAYDGRIYNYTHLVRYQIRECDSYDLSESLQYLWQHKCKIAHDHIYSIRSIMEAYSVITVDYNTSHAEVIHQVFEAFPEELCWCSLRLLLALLPVRPYCASHETQHISPYAERETTTNSCSQTVCQLKVEQLQIAQHPANYQKDLDELGYNKLCKPCLDLRYSFGPFIEFTLDTHSESLSTLECHRIDLPLHHAKLENVLRELKHTQKAFVNRDGMTVQRGSNMHLVRIALWAPIFNYEARHLYRAFSSLSTNMCTLKICLKNGYWEFQETEQDSG